MSELLTTAEQRRADHTRRLHTLMLDAWPNRDSHGRARPMRVSRDDNYYANWWGTPDEWGFDPAARACITPLAAARQAECMDAPLDWPADMDEYRVEYVLDCLEM